MLEIDFDKFLEYEKQLNNFDDELPLIILRLIDTKKYFKNPELKGKMLLKREKLESAENYINFYDEDIKKWIKKYPEFKDLFKKEENYG